MYIYLYIYIYITYIYISIYIGCISPPIPSPSVATRKGIMLGGFGQFCVFLMMLLFLLQSCSIVFEKDPFEYMPVY